MSVKDLVDDDWTEFPTSSFELIDTLDKAFPHQCPPVGADLESIHRYAGARALIDQLIDWRESAKRGADEDSTVS